MNKKHREFFRKLRELCKEHDVSLGPCSRDKDILLFNFKDTDDIFQHDGWFDHEAQTVFQAVAENHSISSEGGDE